LADKSQPWSIYLGHIISRDPASISLGDASPVAGGAYCEPLSFWFDIMSSDFMRDALHASISLGDASPVAGGAYCEPLSFWFDIMSSDFMRDALHLHHKHPRHGHINCLEFVVIMPQLAAVILLWSPLYPRPVSPISPTASYSSQITSP
jgi:hypothetical protein